jgi:hypothetical protein
MIKQGLTFVSIQLIGFLISFYLLAAAITGSHGRLYFSGDGKTVAAIITLILSAPLLYLVFQRRKLRYKKLLFTIAILLFASAMAALYIGLPVKTKQFFVGKQVMNDYPFVNNSDLVIRFDLKPDMFERVGIKANVDKKTNVEIRQFNLTVLDDKKRIIHPVFRPLAWDSLQSETIQMNNFFESNEYSKGNRFALTAQYSIANTSFLTIQTICNYAKDGQEFSVSRQYLVSIANHLTSEKLIEY